MMPDKAKVMVVEDDLALRKSIALSLAKFGFDVLEAEDGLKAVELFESVGGVEAMVVDGKMPLLDGFGTCQRIRAMPQGARIPILLVTGMGEAQAIEQAYSAGASDFILKPIHLGVLSHRLKHLIETSRLQTALSSTRSTLEAVFSSMPSGVIFCNNSGVILEVNPACEKLFGWSPEGMRDLPLRALFANVDSAQQVQTSILSGPMATPLECQLTNATEKPFWAELVGAPVGDGVGGALGAVLVVVDASERIKARQERERGAKLDLMGLLAGGIAHDFNNILTAVLSSITLAQLEVEATSKAAVYLADAQPALEQAKKLSQQLLTFSKGGTPVRSLCDVGGLLRSTVEFSLRGSKISPVFEFEEGCYPAEIDEGQIGQVISNLVVNADQASPKGGRLFVGLANHKLFESNSYSVPAGDYVCVTIRDEGSGIPADVLPKIFDPYFTTKKTGNGLGLATVHSIIKKHGGAVVVSSSMGKGTTFSVYLPAQPLKARVEFIKAPAPQTAYAPSKQKVLLLEDQELIRMAVTKLLEKAGCEVCACEEGAAAVEAYQQSPGGYDVVILDMTLPGGMSGLETFEKLKELDPDVCAIVSTGYADDPVMAHPERYGFRGILPKPYTFAALQEALQSVHR